MKKLPTISELASMELTDREKQDALNVLLNQPPPTSWLKKQDGVTHLPVDKVRFLLYRIFGEWHQEIKSAMTMANSVVVVATLHYKNPLTDEWCKMDGIGAAPINTKKNAGAMDWDQIIHDSVHKCAAAAASFALKNAAKNLGRIFGADLMKDDAIEYKLDEKKFQDATLTEK